MKTLKIGNVGDEVKVLQRKLRGAHFNPGSIDGDFGPATLAAVIGFQKSKRLAPDGISEPVLGFDEN